ncbi:DUF6531 domain-containing protein [Sphingopyxis terrae]|uniref:DUF6531 domain-containing protein n=1 Tax=Sphingopyxis terrae TaxID=33052 RepID=UPI002A0D42BC|nr:DUF6531 domain-containing protein [Sphingopyxis terrae]MDX8356530.1 hypothetical protein [Sphingopyxis terrae]
MVSIFVGSGAGFARGSGTTLGGAGILGSAVQGRGGEAVSVNAATGNLLISQQDEFLVGRGPDIAISRTYNSLAQAGDGDNGDQWQMSSMRRLANLTGTLNSAGSSIQRLAGDGSLVTYSYATRGGVAAYWTTDGGGAHDRLVKSGSNWVWTDGATGTTETYSEYPAGSGSWRIVAQADTDGNTLTFSYNAASGLLDKVTSANGEWVQYVWSGANLTQLVTGYTDLATSTAKALTRTRYAYDGQNRLVQVTVDLSPGDNSIADGKTYVTSYSYDGSSKRVASITQTDGSSLAITYDGSGRVATLTQSVAAGDNRVTTLAYGVSYTSITGPDGQITRLDYDGLQQLTKITAPPAYAGASAQVVQFGYDGDGNLASVTDAAGKVTSYSYDADGNMLTSSDANGNGVTRTYGAKNEMLSETLTGSDASGAAVSHTTRYVYDSENHLRYMISAQGRVTEYRHTPSGQLQSIFDYPEHDYPIGTGAVTEAAMNSWRDAISDRSSVKIKIFAYDARDNLYYSVDYGAATTAGATSTSDGYTRDYYAYDQSGRMLSHYLEGQNAETFVYDGLGRLVASTDKAGASTTILFNDAALTTSVTTGAGFTTVSSYNKAGDLVATSRSGTYDPSGSTSYLYDKLGRVRVATDATGNKSYVIYDKAGRKVADVNHYGHVTEYFYTAAGRVGGSVSYTNALTAAQITALGDPNNMLEMAALRPAAHAYDIWGWSVYDDGGRLVESIAGDGSVARFAYDGSDRLVKTTHFYNKLSAAQLTALRAAPPSAVVVPASDARDTVSRSFYDRDGRLIGALDGEGYLSEIVYDKAGQKVEEIAYAAKTGSTYWDAGSFDQLRASAAPTSSSNRRARYVYDGQGLLRFAIDTAGYVTEYVYESDVKWGAVGLARSTIVHATAIATSDFTYDNVKALVAANAGNAANRKSFAVYDAAGRLAYAIDAEGAVTGFAYDAMGHVIKTVAYAAKRATSALPTEAVMNSWRDANIGNAANRVTRAWYTAAGNLRFTVDAEGYVTRNDYDAEGRLTAIKRWPDKIVTTDVTSIATVDVLTLSAGTAIIETRTYDAAGHLSTTTDGEGVITAYYYYANGSQYLTVFAYGTADEARVVRGFDGAGRVVSEYAAYGQPEQAVTAYSYDGLGNLTSVTDPRGKVTTFSYDERGLRLTATDAAGGVTTYQYNAFGEVTQTTDPRGAVTYRYYDALGRVVMTRDAENYITETSYTRFGEIASVTRRYNKTVSAASTMTLPAVTPHAKDATTLFEYDKRGLVTKTTDAEGWFESYGYDAFGNRTYVVAKSKEAGKVAGGTTTYAYDRRGMLITETLPIAAYKADGSVQASSISNSYSYDARGNRILMIEADGLIEERRTTYEYDKNDRLTRTLGQARTILDQSNHVTTTAGFVPTETIAYDAAGRITTVTDAAGNRTVYYYDALGRRIVEIDAAGTYTRHSYDAAGNVTETRVYATAVTVPAAGGGSPPAAPSGASRATSFTYDDLGRLLTSSVAGATTGAWNGSAWVSSASAIATAYEYDANGNVVKATDAGGNIVWSYFDKLGRKTAQVDAGGYLTAWTYDGEGNVLTETRYANAAAAPSSTVTPPTVTANAAADRVTAFTYDRNGNRLSEARANVVVHNAASPGTTTTVTATVNWLYNGLGQVIRKTEATGDQTNYTYDVGGRLTQEQRAAFTSHQGTSVTPTVDYLYTGLGDLARTVAAGSGDAASRITTYSYGAGGLLQSVSDASGYVHTYAYDKLGIRIRDQYSRVDAAGTSTLNAILIKVDALGRTVEQSIAAWTGSAWAKGDVSATEYDAFGSVSRSGINGLWQSENRYDAAGRLVATNAGDGVWKLFGYDRNGNQTIAITSAGENLAGLTFAQAFAKIGQANVNATYTVYDARNMATSTIEEGRQLVGTSDSQTLISSRSYNAFGETASETNAAGATTSYSYNRIGRMIRSEGPTVQITLENGTSLWVKPSQDYYYDASGRLVATRDANGDYAAGGTAANGTSKAANSGNLTRLTLLAGTGYDGSEALVTAETHADGGVKQTKYDIHGDARTLIDEIGRTTTRSFDAMGRVTQVGHAGGLIDYYAYDGIGQRIKHWNSFLGSGEVETTDYDTQGRVSKTRAFGGDITTIATTWDATIAASGMGITTGGWSQLTTMANGKTLTEKSDIFGRATYKNDLGSHVTSYAYDVAGRQVSSSMGGATSAFTWFNTGQIASNSNATGTESYTYDATGNRVSEYWVGPSSLLKTAVATYDALGRLLTWNHVGGTLAPASSTTHLYDANGNIRATTAVYASLSGTGTAAGTRTQSYWFRFDSMNRLVVDKGKLSGAAGAVGTAIVRNDALDTSHDIAYNAAGERTEVRTTLNRPAKYYELPNGDPTFLPARYWEVREAYSYDTAGRLAQVRISSGSEASDGAPPWDYPDGNPDTPVPAAPTPTVLRSSLSYDAMGRQTAQTDYDSNGTTVIFSRTTVWNSSGKMDVDDSSTLRYRANAAGPTDLLRSRSVYGYGTGTGYALGNALTITTQAWKNGIDTGSNGAPDTLTTNIYSWYDGAVQTSVTFDGDTGSSSNALGTTTYSYDGRGLLTGVSVSDGRARTVSFVNDVNGQAVRRDEADGNAAQGDPHEIWYRYAGKQMGYTGNNGTLDMDWQTSLTDRMARPPAFTGPFRDGSSTSKAYADFTASYDAYNSYAQTSASGRYTGRSGETLATVAASLYGDANLWYKLAEANGLGGNATLSEGQQLTLPTGVSRNTHNASTFKPYDPAEIIGDTMPTMPKPPKGARCGVFGQILIAAVAIGLSVWLGPQFIGVAAKGGVAGETETGLALKPKNAGQSPREFRD